MSDWNFHWNIQETDRLKFDLAFYEITTIGCQLICTDLHGIFLKWFSSEKSNFLISNFIERILLRNSTIWVENHCIGIYRLFKSLHRCLIIENSKIFLKTQNATLHRVPGGLGGSENSQNFPELVGGGHPGVQLLCKVPDYSTRVKTWNQILVFDCFKFNDAPLELVGGDPGEGQILFTSSKFD